ncbi:MAG: DNA-binding response regulator [Desulfovibrio sp.]|nr:MAG: DNA-binding response regulator [Desulfovibrio sp.]
MVDSIQVLIVDDHPLTREGLIAVLKRDEAFKVCGEAGTGEECLSMTAKLEPDVVLLDITLPDVSGFDLARQLLSQRPELKIMAISMHSKMEYLTQAFQAGILGYVVKGSPAQQILEGVRTVARGEYYLDSSISPKVVRKLTSPSSQSEPSIHEGPQELSRREVEVLVLLAEGLSTRDVSERLFISPKTVEGHRTRIMKKLDLHTPVDLVRYAAKAGLIDLKSS